MKYEILKYIGANAGLFSYINTSTRKIAKETGISQQSVSRLLIELEKEDAIKRNSTPKGIEVMVAKKGRDILRKEYSILKKILKAKSTISGRLFKGIGQGSYYVKAYESRLKKVLGYSPYLGTLNLHVKPNEYESFISDIKPIIVNGFKTKSRDFGNITIYKVILGGISAAILKPERTLHKEDVMEIIGPSCFRSGLDLKEDDKVEVRKNAYE